MSVADEKLPTTRPSQDPNRKEVLTISGLTVNTRRVRMVVYEVLRDQQDRLRELKPLFQDAPTDAQNPLLEVLFFGFAMGLSTDTK